MSCYYLILHTLNTGTYGKLIVTLDGDAKLAQSDSEGLYTLASSPVNGKEYWIQDQGSNAIWYDNEDPKNWVLGPKKNLGSGIFNLYSTNDTTGPEEARTWNYNRNGEWKPTSNIFGSSSMYKESSISTVSISAVS